MKTRHPGRSRLLSVAVAIACACALACSRKSPEERPGPAGPASSGPAGAAGARSTPPAGAAARAETPPVAEESPLPDVASPYDDLPDEARAAVFDQAFTGDLDQMIKRRVIRAGVPYNRTQYFVDKGQQRGIAYESLMNFEEQLNARLKTGNMRVHVAFIPLPRDLLIPALTEGRVDLVAASLTVTPEREKRVAFSSPTRTNVNEVVVTGPGAPAIATLDDLSGKEVFVRKTSSYHESLLRMNAALAAKGKEPVRIKPAPETFEDDDILEMVNAGLVPITVVDDYLAEFWTQILTGLVVHRDLALRTGGTLAVAVRKNNPKLRDAANQWLKTFGERTAFGNVLQKRYLQGTKFVKSAGSEAERQKFITMVRLFRKYGAQYDLDPLLMAAQGYQESTLDQDVRSQVGAIGVMQVMPATGKDLKVGDISQLEPNIHAGVKYMRFMIDQYYKDEPMTPLNKGLMTFASYNAGPGRIRQLRREAEKRGLDKNVWFGNVEQVASEKIGRETVTYVGNIYKYYIAYKLVVEQLEAKGQLDKPGAR